MLDLESAIKHCEEVAELNDEKEIEYAGQEMYIFAKDCRKCASEHRQLAEWLRELKAYREGCKCEDCKYQKSKYCNSCYAEDSSFWEYKGEVNADDSKGTD